MLTWSAFLSRLILVFYLTFLVGPWFWFLLALCWVLLASLVLWCCLWPLLLLPTAMNGCTVLCLGGCIKIWPIIKLDQICSCEQGSDLQQYLETPPQSTISLVSHHPVRWIYSMSWKSMGSSSSMSAHQTFLDYFLGLFCQVVFYFDHKPQFYSPSLLLYDFESHYHTAVACFAYGKATLDFARWLQWTKESISTWSFQLIVPLSCVSSSTYYFSEGRRIDLGEI